MNFKDFQVHMWNEFFSKDITSFMQSLTYKFDDISIEFEPINASQFLEQSNTTEITRYKSLEVNVVVKLANEESIRFPVNLIELPIYTSEGFIFDNTRWMMINTNCPAGGWYITPGYRNRLYLSYRRGSQEVIKVRLHAAGFSRDDISIAPLYSNKKKNVVIDEDNSTDIKLLDFLRVFAGSAKTVDDICDELSDSRLLSEMRYNYKATETLEDIASNIVTKFYGTNRKSEDPVYTFNEFLSLNRYHVGAEKIERFKNFCSFRRAEGYSLAGSKELTVNPDGISETVIRPGDALTGRVIRQLDKSDLTELQVKDDLNHVITLRKCKVDEGLTYEEFKCALLIYAQLLEGIGQVDDPDDFNNKIIHSVREEVEDLISNAVYDLIKQITKSLQTDKNAHSLSLLTTNFTTKYKLDMVRKKMLHSKVYQQFDNTNSLATFDQTYRITTTANEVPNSTRDIKSLQYGRVCPYTTPESKQVGLNLSMTLMSELDKYGFISTPVHKFDNGKLSEDKVYLNAIAELNEVIAPSSVNLIELAEEYKGNFTSCIVENCKVSGKIISVSLADVTAQYLAGVQTLGPLLALAPAVTMNAPKRLTMCASAQRQALIPYKTEYPYLCTGIESDYNIGVTTARDLFEYYYNTRSNIADNISVLSENSRVYYDRKGSTTKKGTLYAKFILIPDINEQTRYDVTKALRPCRSTMKGSVNYIRLAPPTNKDDVGRMYYTLDDTVLYNSDIDITSHKVSSIPSSQATDEHMQNRAIAIGNNCNILFKSFDGFTYEDSVVVTEDFLQRRGLSIIKTCSLDFPLCDDKKEVIVEPRPIIGSYVRPGQEILTFMRYSDDEKSKYIVTRKVEVGKEGFILSCEEYNYPDSHKHGVRIELGEIADPAVGDKIEGLHGNKGVIGRILKNWEVPYTEDGEMPDIILNPLSPLARLNLGQLIESVAGAIGKKRDEACIMEPFAKISISDLIKNAEKYGIREKEIYDGRTGLKYAKPALIGNMYMLRLEHTDTSKYNAASDCRSLISPRTNQPCRGHGGGQRISEMGTWCFIASGAEDALSSLFTVQSDSKEKGELDEAFSRGESNIDVSFESNNLDFLQQYFHMLGAHIAVDCDTSENTTTNKGNTRIRLELLTEDFINSTIDNECRRMYNEYSSRENTPQLILHDEAVFGNNADDKETAAKLYFGCKMIMPLILTQSAFCNLIVYACWNKSKCEVEKYKLLSTRDVDGLINGKYRLAGWFKPVVRLSTDMLNNLEHKYGVTVNAEQVPLIPIIVKTAACESVHEVINSSDSSTDYSYEAIADNSYEYGIRSLVYLFENCDPMSSIYTGILNDQQTANVISFLRNYSLSDCIVEHMVIPPLGYRKLGEDKKMSNPIDAVLTQVVSDVGKLQNAPIGDASEAETALYRTLLNVTSKKDNTIASLREQLTKHQSKSSIIRDTLLAKRVTYSGRSVISIEPNLKFGECGLPVAMLTTIFEKLIIHELSSSRSTYTISLLAACCKSVSSGSSIKFLKNLCPLLANENFLGFYTFVSKSCNYNVEKLLSDISTRMRVQVPLYNLNALYDVCYKELLALLKHLVAQHPAILSRQPELHKFSVQGMHVVPMPGYTIRLHPLTCHGYNADFDGDQMQVTFPMETRGINSVQTSMMAENNVINPKDGSCILSLSQDMILGLYYATIHKNNSINFTPDDICGIYNVADIPDTYTINNPIIADVLSGVISVHDTIIAVYKSQHYLAEAGRIIVNCMLPDNKGFSNKPLNTEYTINNRTYPVGYFSELAIDFVLSKKTVNKLEEICMSCLDSDNINRLGYIYDNLMKFGFAMADLSGITISLADMNNLPVKEQISKDRDMAEAKERALIDWYNMGACTQEDKSDSITKLWQETTTSLKNLLKTSFNAITDNTDQPLNRQSNIFMILDSGARGDVKQLLEIAGMVGSVMNNSGQFLETPVRNSYLEGLTPEQFTLNAISGRRQIAAAQLSTAESGEFTRDCIYLNEHLHITNNDEACDAEPTWMSVKYNVRLEYSQDEEFYKVNNTYMISSEEAKAALADGVSLEMNEDAKQDCPYWIMQQDVSEYLKIYFIKYAKFCDTIRPIYEANPTLKTFEQLLDLYNQTFFFIKTPDSVWHYISVAFSLTDESKNMLRYRVLAYDKISDSANEGAWTGANSEYSGEDFNYSVIGDAIFTNLEYGHYSKVPIYTILGCKCTTGICKRCYGLKYDTHKFPASGECIGHQAVQAVGEPLTQIVLDSHKRDASSVSPKEELDEILENKPSVLSEEQDKLKPEIAYNGGTFRLTRDTDSRRILAECVNIQDDKEVISTSIILPEEDPLSNLVVRPGDTVKQWEKIGYVPVSDLSSWLEQITYKKVGKKGREAMALTDDVCEAVLGVKVELWRKLCHCFSSDKVLSRNLEIFARSLTEHGRAHNSNYEGNIIAGNVYNTSLLERYGVTYSPVFLTLKKSIAASNKVLAAVAFENAFKGISSAIVSGNVDYGDSFVALSLTGNYSLTKCKPHSKSVVEWNEIHKSLAEYKNSENTNAPSDESVSADEMFFDDAEDFNLDDTDINSVDKTEDVLAINENEQSSQAASTSFFY